MVVKNPADDDLMLNGMMMSNAMAEHWIPQKS